MNKSKYIEYISLNVCNEELKSPIRDVKNSNTFNQLFFI